jgi:hypothetical protein
MGTKRKRTMLLAIAAITPSTALAACSYGVAEGMGGPGFDGAVEAVDGGFIGSTDARVMDCAATDAPVLGFSVCYGFAPDAAADARVTAFDSGCADGGCDASGPPPDASDEGG